MKIGLIFVGTLALVFVVFGLIWAILGNGGSEATDESPELRDPTEITQPTDASPPDSPAISSNQVTLFANGGDVYVTVTQKNDGLRIYSGSVTVDNPLTLDKSGPIEIIFTRGENLIIESNGERFRPSASGAAKITID